MNNCNKRILFIMSAFYPETGANGVCVKAISKELLHDGFDVHVLTQEDGKDTIVDGVNVHYISKNLFIKMQKYGEQNPTGVGRLCYKTAMLLNKIQKLLMIPWYPHNHPVSLYKFYFKALNLHKKYKFDKVIGVYRPEQSTLAAIKFKKKFPDVQTAIYVSDSLIYSSKTKYLTKGLSKKFKWRFEKKVYEGVDKVFNIRCHEIHHKDAKYNKYRDKMIFLDTPLFEPAELPVDFEPMFDKNKIQWSYMGTMFDGYREPYYMSRLVEAIEDQFDIQIQFFTRGSCESWLVDNTKNNPNHYVRHGYVNNSLTPIIYANSDFLVNLGVKTTTMISSKIFLYMAYGKPIIHFYYQDDDVCNPYLQKYPGSCLIQMKDELFEENKNKLCDFINDNLGKKYDSKMISNLFYENTPRFSANAFEESWV